MGAMGPCQGNNATSDPGIGSIFITSPLNMLLGGYAVAVLLLGQSSQYLKVTGFNINIPDDAVVTGITVTINRFGSILSSVTDNSVRIVKGNTIQGDNKALPDGWPVADTVAVYGDENDPWGLDWTPADINDPNFGVAISAKAGLAATAKIGEINILVSYIGSNRIGDSMHHLTADDGISVSSAESSN